MNPNAHQPSREDVLDAFAVEPSHGREILERYLREYPHFSNELVGLSRELSRVPDVAERPMSLQEQAMSVERGHDLARIDIRERYDRNFGIAECVFDTFAHAALLGWV